MLFHVFHSQSDRRSFGGSDFIEIQYCQLAQGSTIDEIVSCDSIVHWKEDSLYISGDDMDVFFQHYGNILTDGIYNNQSCGPMDLYGINFYSHEQAVSIQEKLKTETPLNYQVFYEWLQGIDQYIGFYVLGL